jgi:hypothetical protein
MTVGASEYRQGTFLDVATVAVKGYHVGPLKLSLSTSNQCARTRSPLALTST